MFKNLKNSLGAAAIFSALSILSTSALATPVKKADDHAPIGVMGDHLHKEGEFMVGYRYENTSSRGIRNGRKTVSADSLLNTYGEVPVKMEMGMHMFEIMYGITDNFTLMLMPQYMQMDMTHKDHMGTSGHGHGGLHSHKVEGFGDTELTGLYSIFNGSKGDINAKIHLNFGLSLPTGSIDKTFMNHHNRVYNLPYNMQFGSGTYDPIIGLTYSGENKDWSWGAQTINYIRLGKNDEGYRQGNKYSATAWGTKNLNDNFSVSLRLDGEAWNNVNGRDISLPLTAIAGADPKGQAGERVMANIGINFLGDKSLGVLSGNRLAAEFGVPVYERFSGPQPKTDYRLTLGWQMAF